MMPSQTEAYEIKYWLICIAGNGVIDFDEFLELLSKKMGDGDSEDEMRDAFKVFDKDGDGHITADELKKVIKTLNLLLV